MRKTGASKGFTLADGNSEQRRARQALDDLAELFLTGPADPADADGHGVNGAEKEANPETPAAAEPGLSGMIGREPNKPAAGGEAKEGASMAERSKRNGGAGLEGPTPIRLAPKVGAGGASQTAGAPREGTPSQLRLHRPQSERDPQGQSSASRARASEAAPGWRVRSEAVVLGNLPGLSAPWLTQYAQRLAQEAGPVAVLHVGEQEIDAEVVEATDRPQKAARIGPGEASGDLVEQLAELARPGGLGVRRVLVNVEAADAEVAAARLVGLERWTLLCGADEAAVVGGYRLLKRLHDAGASPEAVGLMVMGSESEKCEAAARKLAEAAGRFLDAAVEPIGHQRQMMPVNLRQLGRFGPTEAVWPRLLRWLHGQAADEAVREPSEPVPDRESAAEAMFESAARSGQPSTATAEADRGAEDSPAAATTVDEPEPEPGAADRSLSDPGTSATDPAEPDLAALVSTGGALAGGLALEARCPHQPGTQFMLDTAGRLHLLKRQDLDETGGESGELAQLRRAVVELLEARQWVREHLDLLRLTQRQCRFSGEAEPMLHLFTHRADLACGLAARLGAGLKVHLLKSIRAGGSITWICEPLN